MPDASAVEALSLDRKSERATRVRQISNSLIKKFRRDNISHDDSVSAMLNLVVAGLEMAQNLTLARRLEIIDAYARNMKQAIIANADKRKGMM